MITFKQYLREETRDLIKFLRDNCDQAVHDMYKADGYFWRGAKKTGTEHFTFGDDGFRGFFGYTREDRTPRNTPPWAHEAINSYFKKEFGEPLRSNTVFADARRVSAAGYGSVFALIPIGNYKVYWSKSVEDLTSTLFPSLDEDEPDDSIVVGDIHHWGLKTPTKEEQIEYIVKFLDHAHYIEGDIGDALKSRSELMIKCSSYLALSISESELTHVIQEAAVDEKVEQ